MIPKITEAPTLSMTLGVQVDDAHRLRQQQAASDDIHLDDDGQTGRPPDRHHDSITSSLSDKSAKFGPSAGLDNYKVSNKNTRKNNDQMLLPASALRPPARESSEEPSKGLMWSIDASTNSSPPSPHMQIRVSSHTSGPKSDHSVAFIDDSPRWPPNESSFLEAIRRVIETPPVPRSATPFIFEFSTEAAEHNAELLRRHNFNVHAAVYGDRSSILYFGAEFRSIAQFRTFLEGHPLWHRMEQTLRFGARYPLLPLDDATQQQDLEAAIEYGNHKSARKHGTAVLAALRNEVKRGWQLPLPLWAVWKIPRAVIAPVGMAEQAKLLADGSRVPGLRLTHDMSFDFTKGTSVNHRVLHLALTACIYGFALSRFFHQIIALRLHFGPLVRLLLAKLDLKSAFRRMQTDAELAAQSIITTKGLEDETLAKTGETIALMALRLTFGGAPNPSLFEEFSETLTDVANTLTNCPSWDAKTLHSPHHNTLEPTKYVPDDPLTGPVPAALGKPLMVPVVPKLNGYAECFIDDIFSVMPDLPAENKQPDRMAQATLLAIEAFGMPPHPDDPLPRDDLLSLTKAAAEGTPAELLIVLGWLIDVRRLLASLPEDKYLAWKSDIEEILRIPRRTIPYKDLDSLLGRLQHVCAILRQGWHFLSRLRGAKNRAGNTHARRTRLSKAERSDLELWLKFLALARAGVDINNLVVRIPDTAGITDACTYQIGGYSVTTGRAWRWPLPSFLVGHKSINFLEYLASAAAYLLGVLEGEIVSGNCHLHVTDNSTNTSWTRKSNFAPDGEHEAHYHLSRLVARTTLQLNGCQFSQWLAGRKNLVADLISREQNLSDEQLTILIKTKFPLQVPDSFKISPLPEKLISLLSALVQLGQPDPESPKTPTGKTTDTGDGGSPSSSAAKSKTTSFFDSLVFVSDTGSSPPLPTPSVAANSADPQDPSSPMARLIRWVQERSLPHSRMWERPSSHPDSPTLDSILDPAILHSFYYDK